MAHTALFYSRECRFLGVINATNSGSTSYEPGVKQGRKEEVECCLIQGLGENGSCFFTHVVRFCLTVHAVYV